MGEIGINAHETESLKETVEFLTFFPKFLAFLDGTGVVSGPCSSFRADSDGERR